MIHQRMLESLQDDDDSVNGKSKKTEKILLMNMQKHLHNFLQQRKNRNKKSFGSGLTSRNSAKNQWKYLPNDTAKT